MCCCDKNTTCAEGFLFALGIITFVISIPGIFYSLVFWLFATAFSAGQGWFLGIPFIITFCLLCATGILETFYASNVCCKNMTASCRQCTLTAAIVMRAIVICLLVFMIVFFANLDWFYGSTYDAPPPYPPSAAPSPYPAWPPAPPYQPFPPAVDALWPHMPPNPPMHPVGGDGGNPYIPLIVWLTVIFVKLLATLALDVAVLRDVRAKAVKAAAAPPPVAATGMAPPIAVATGVPVHPAGMEMGALPLAAAKPL